MQEFQREARVAARLSHPNIVQIFDFSKYEDEYFFAMEYVHGIDLREALRLCRDAKLRWPIGMCLRVISDVCAGLEAAHSYRNEDDLAVPIYHRDVSPENVLPSASVWLLASMVWVDVFDMKPPLSRDCSSRTDTLAWPAFTLMSRPAPTASAPSALT